VGFQKRGRVASAVTKGALLCSAHARTVGAKVVLLAELDPSVLRFDEGEPKPEEVVRESVLGSRAPCRHVVDHRRHAAEEIEIAHEDLRHWRIVAVQASRLRSGKGPDARDGTTYDD